MPTGKRSSRVVLNRRGLDQVRLVIGDGVHEVGKAIVTTARPPDAQPYGVGLVTTGGVLTYVDGKRIDARSETGGAPKQPRRVRVGGTKGAMAIVGYGFPGRFQELGTSHNPPQPFLTPARNAVIPRVNGIMRKATAYRLARLRTGTAT